MWGVGGRGCLGEEEIRLRRCLHGLPQDKTPLRESWNSFKPALTAHHGPCKLSCLIIIVSIVIVMIYTYTRVSYIMSYYSVLENFLYNLNNPQDSANISEPQILNAKPQGIAPQPEALTQTKIGLTWRQNPDTMELPVYSQTVSMNYHAPLLPSPRAWNI